MISDKTLQEFSTFLEPGALLAALHQRYGTRLAIATSGQPTDTAIISLAKKAGVKNPRVYTTDTLRLFPETYAYFNTLETFFGIRIERVPPPENELQKMVGQHGEYLFFDSKDKQEYCCHVRKVLPNQTILEGLDVWVTGLRRDQSASRANLPTLEVIEHRGRPLLKVNPLADWTEQQVRDYLKTNAVPNHPLIEASLPGGWRYESLGCFICTTPVAPHEPGRAGRWRWFNALEGDKKECGLHLPPPKQ